MSLIGKNIKKIRMVKKMSQAEFASLFHVARPSIGAYEEGRAEPKIDTVIMIAKQFGISIDALLTKEITINELLKFKILEKDALKKGPDTLLETVPFVPENLMYEYIIHFKNRDFIESLPGLNIPKIQSKKSRAFQVSGSEMKKDQFGIQYKDILICSFNETIALEKNKVYVIVTNEGVSPKRFVSEDNLLLFHHDNPAYENLNIPRSEILECWEPKLIISSNLPALPALESRVDELEDKLKTLMEQMMKGR